MPLRQKDQKYICTKQVHHNFLRLKLWISMHFFIQRTFVLNQIWMSDRQSQFNQLASCTAWLANSTKRVFTQICKGVQLAHDLDRDVDFTDVECFVCSYERLKRNGTSEEEAAKELISDRKDSSKYLSVQLFTDNAVNPCINGTYK